MHISYERQIWLFCSSEEKIFLPNQDDVEEEMTSKQFKERFKGFPKNKKYIIGRVIDEFQDEIDTMDFSNDSSAASTPRMSLIQENHVR